MLRPHLSRESGLNNKVLKYRVLLTYRLCYMNSVQLTHLGTHSTANINQYYSSEQMLYQIGIILIEPINTRPLTSFRHTRFYDSKHLGLSSQNSRQKITVQKVGHKKQSLSKMFIILRRPNLKALRNFTLQSLPPSLLSCIALRRTGETRHLLFLYKKNTILF